jgi:hypothetical protein
LCGSRNLGPEALEKVIAVLGVEIVLVPKGMLAFGKHVSLERNNDLSTSKMRKIAALGGKARWANVPPEDRTAHAQLIAEVRWKGEARRRKMNTRRARQNNEAVMAIWRLMIIGGSISPPVTHGFFTGPGMAGLTGGGFLKRKGRKRAAPPLP